MDWYSTLLPTITEPIPDLQPEHVIRIQLDALQNNDLLRYNTGIRIAFNFASPANRVFTGPLPHFIDMLKNPLYSPLIGFERADLSPIMIIGDVAQQRVHIKRKDEHAVFTFLLSRQTEPPYQNCWMVDSVIRES